MSNPITYGLVMFFGHNDYRFLPVVKQISKSKGAQKNNCSCGKSDKTKTKSVYVDAFAYKSRCPCLREKRMCGDDCSCCGCVNVSIWKTRIKQN